MLTEKFPETALGAIALDGGTNRRGGGDDADSRAIDGAFAPPVPERERPAVESLALLAYGAKLAWAADMLLRTETHGTTTRRGRVGSDDRQTLATLAATQLQDLAAATGGHAGAITNLAGALFAMRAKCRFHGFWKKRGSEVPAPPGSVKGRVLAGRVVPRRENWNSWLENPDGLARPFQEGVGVDRNSQ